MPGMIDPRHLCHPDLPDDLRPHVKSGVRLLPCVERETGPRLRRVRSLRACACSHECPHDDRTGYFDFIVIRAISRTRRQRARRTKWGTGPRFRRHTTSGSSSRIRRTPGWPPRRPACSQAWRSWGRRSRDRESGRWAPRRARGHARRRRPPRAFPLPAVKQERRP
jgi:hypothetical protein